MQAGTCNERFDMFDKHVRDLPDLRAMRNESADIGKAKARNHEGLMVWSEYEGEQTYI